MQNPDQITFRSIPFPNQVLDYIFKYLTMDNLPLEILVHVFSFTDVKTWHNCRETCSTIAHLLKKRVFVIKSMQMKDFYTILRMLKRTKSDRVSVRFTKVPKATSTEPNIRRIYEELSTVVSITELDVSELDSKVSLVKCFPSYGFAHLESVRFSASSNSAVILPNLTKLCGAGSSILSHPSASQLLDLEFQSRRAFPEHCTNLTRLLMYCGQGIDLQRLTALKDLNISCYSSMPNQIQIATSNLESLQISDLNMISNDILKNLNLTRLSFCLPYIKGPDNEVLDLSPWRLLTRLRDLSIDNVSTTAPLSFMNGLPNLERLAIRGITPINDFSSEILPRDGSRLTRLVTVNIPYLDLSHFTALCDIKVTNGIGKIPSNNLTAIEANRGSEITFLGSLTSVRSLKLQTCADFNDFPNLESLSVGQLIQYPIDTNTNQSLSVLTLLTRLIILEDNNVDLPYLASLMNLVQLHILSSNASEKKSARRHVRNITNLQKLEELTLPRSITQQELDSISIHLTRLTYLTMQSKDGDGSAFTRLTNLVEVHFNGPNKIKGLAKLLESRLPYLVMFEEYDRWKHQYRFL